MEFNINKLKIVVKPCNVILFSKDNDFKITKELYEIFVEAGKIAWKTLNYHDVTGLGNDYAEYYDKKLDSNGYLFFRGSELLFERPYEDKEKLYQFNKAKFQTFMFDLKNSVSSLE